MENFFSSKVPEFSHVALKLMEKHCPVFFSKVCASFSIKKRMQKTKFFLVTSLRSFVQTRNKRNLLFQSNKAWLFAACKSFRSYNEVIEIHFD